MSRKSSPRQAYWGGFAPRAAVRKPAFEPRGSTRCRHSASTQINDSGKASLAMGEAPTSSLQQRHRASRWRNPCSQSARPSQRQALPPRSALCVGPSHGCARRGEPRLRGGRVGQCTHTWLALWKAVSEAVCSATAASYCCPAVPHAETTSPIPHREDGLHRGHPIDDRRASLAARLPLEQSAAAAIRISAHCLAGSAPASPQSMLQASAEAS